MRRMGGFDEQKTIGELTDINLKDKVDGVIKCTKEAASTLLGDIPSEDIDFIEGKCRRPLSEYSAVVKPTRGV